MPQPQPLPSLPHSGRSNNLDPTNKRVVWKPVLSTPFSIAWPELSPELSNTFLDQLLQLLDHRHSSHPNLIPTQPDQSQSIALNIAQYRNHRSCQKRRRKSVARSENRACQLSSNPAPCVQSSRPKKIHTQNDKKPKLSHPTRPFPCSESSKDAMLYTDSPVGSTAISIDKEKSHTSPNAHLACDIEINTENSLLIHDSVLEPQYSSSDLVSTIQDQVMEGPIDSRQVTAQSGELHPMSPHTVKEILQPTHFVKLRSDKVVAIPDFVPPVPHKPANAKAAGPKRKSSSISELRPALLDYAVIGINAVTKSLESEIAQATRLKTHVGSSKSKPSSRLNSTLDKGLKSSAESNKLTTQKDAQEDGGLAQSALEPNKNQKKLSESISEIIDTLLDARLPTDSMSFQWAEVSRMQTYQHHPRNRLPYQPRRTHGPDDSLDRIQATSLAQLPRSSTWFPRFNVTQAQLIENSTVDPMFIETETIDLTPFEHETLLDHGEPFAARHPSAPVQEPDLSKDKQHSDLLLRSRLNQSTIRETYRTIFNYFTPHLLRALTIKQNHIRPRDLRQLSIKQILKLTERKDSVRYIKPRIPAAQASYAPRTWKAKARKSAVPAPRTWKAKARKLAVPPDDPTSVTQLSGAQAQVEPPDESKGGLELIFVCKDDLNPSTLVDHLLPTVATLNHVRTTKKHMRSVGGEEEERIDDDQSLVYLVRLPKGAESRVARLLGIKRAAVLGLPHSTPGLSELRRLAQRFLEPVLAPQMAGSSLEFKSEETNGTRLELIPTHIKHYKSSAPVDIRKFKADKSVRRKGRRKNKKMD